MGVFESVGGELFLCIYSVSSKGFPSERCVEYDNINLLRGQCRGPLCLQYTMLAVFRSCFLALTRVTTKFHTPLLPVSSLNQQTRWPNKPNLNCSQQMCVCAILAPHHIRAMIPHRENTVQTSPSQATISCYPPHLTASLAFRKGYNLPLSC